MPLRQRGLQRRAIGMAKPELRTSSAAWLEGVLSMFEAEGLDVPSLLNEAGFDPDSLHRQNARIPVDEITVLWQFAVARAGRPTLGLHRDLASTHSKLGTVGHAMACSPDLQGALTRVARYMAVISDATAFSLQPEARGCWMVMKHTGGKLPIPRQRVEYALLTVLMQCQWLARRELQPLAMEFVYPAPPDARLHREAFGCEVRFNASANRLLLSDADMTTPLPTYHQTLGEMQEHLLDDQLTLLGQTRTSSLVCAEIARRLPHGEPRRQDVASDLGLAERTLQRRLQEESVSFQALLDRTRRELAQEYLAEDRHTLTDVADMLGFVDTSNFFRACKRWFGVPPAQYRARIWDGPAALAA
ncbi:MULTISPECIES: AraC family transcriptional regulator [unclassified Variovorax]|uniref:AraC family transcriptional regulator n=1 Tax=unclassified Variovorax TaxID=663243 RepID=UPI00086D69C5|nr:MULTISPECIES: AraC family transcriptional regulator [unclassified Variovorax]MBN8756002.1 AraC family transcriptional regulator [Variovorax sp.]ODU11892.1 MAG: AraC family transcriptional regulator [Variovorax sp. SCN 67-85]ODV14745.1 MAG: AraC family transcriptional regulator [Variovorax sp. SCN 67-20]OJZ05540.1 MAG: AraC family transcriptional regulator [Variovorax sp. 67-131]